MAIFQDAQTDSASLAKLVNEDTDVTTRYGAQPKKSIPKVLREFEEAGDAAIESFNQEGAEALAEFDLTLDQYKESRGFNTKGTFAAGFTYELPNDVGLDASGNPWILIDTSSLPVAVTAGTTPTNPPYKQVVYGTAAQVSTNTSDTAQSFIDSFALKIFQSPTDELTEINTRTLTGGGVYEVRKVSDDTLATIYSDKGGLTEIVQNGTSNVSGGDGVVEFYIADGDYYITANSLSSDFKTYETKINIGSYTLSDAQQLSVKTGQTINISDYGDAEYAVVDISDLGGFYLTLNANLKLKLVHNGTIQVKKLGLVTNDMSAIDSNSQLIEQARAAGVKEFLYEPELYYIRKIELPHTGSYYRNDTGETHKGVKGSTELSRGENQATDTLDYSDEDIFREQCLLRVYGSFHRVEGLNIKDSAGGVFMGQDPARAPLQPSPEFSSIAFNVFSDMVVYNSGTAFVSASTNLGTYFNSFTDLHLQQCQIGFDSRQGKYNSLLVSNFNRNFFNRVRASRCYVGQLFADASTNYGVILNEGNTSTATNNKYTYPSQSITGIDISHGDGIGAALGPIASDNTITFINESCDRYIQDENGSNNYIGGTPRVLENTTTGDVSTLLDRDGLVQEDFIYATINRLQSVPYLAGQINLLSKTCQHMGGAEKNSDIVPLGPMLASSSTQTTISADNVGLVDSTSLIECKLVADCPSSNLGFTKTFYVTIKRNASRTPTRYYVSNEIDSRATGANTGDSAEPFSVSLSLSGKDLVLDITAPARDFDSVDLFINEYLGDNRV